MNAFTRFKFGVTNNTVSISCRKENTKKNNNNHKNNIGPQHSQNIKKKKELTYSFQDHHYYKFSFVVLIKHRTTKVK